MTMMRIMLCVVLLLALCGMTQAAGGLEIESAGLVAVYPLSGEESFGGSLVTGRISVPWRVFGVRIADVIKGGLVLHNEGSMLDPRDLLDLSKMRAYPALVMQAHTKIGLPVSVGLCYLPLTKIRGGIVASLDLWRKDL